MLAEPAPVVLVSDFGDSSLTFMRRVWISDFDNCRRVPSELRSPIDRVFRQHGVEIAFPQRDLHIRSAPGLGRAFGKLLERPTPARAEGT